VPTGAGQTLDEIDPEAQHLSAARTSSSIPPTVLDQDRTGLQGQGFIYEHPPPRPAVFVGRDCEIQQLIDAIDGLNPCVIAVIGIAGQGKTALVAHTLRTSPRFSFSHGLWVSAGQGGYTFNHFLDTALSYFVGAELSKSRRASVEARSRRLIRHLQERQILIVIDGIERWLAGWQMAERDQPFEQPESRAGAYKGVDEFISAATSLQNGSHVIITSRALPAALDLLDTVFIPVIQDRPKQSVSC
jgi:NB-ARC domain